MAENIHVSPQIFDAYELEQQDKLLEACRQGNTAQIVACLKAGAHVNGLPGAMHTPLILSAFLNRVESVRTLIDCSASPHVRSLYGGGTALHKAALYGHMEVMELLLAEARADPNARDYEDRTPMHCAASQGQVQSVQCLLQSRGDLRATTRQSKTPLALACESGHKQVAQLITQLLTQPVGTSASNTSTSSQELATRDSSSSMRSESSTHTSETQPLHPRAPQRVSSSFQEPFPLDANSSPNQSIQSLTLVTGTDVADPHGPLSSTESLPLTPPIPAHFTTPTQPSIKPSLSVIPPPETSNVLTISTERHEHHDDSEPSPRTSNRLGCVCFSM